MTDNQKDRQWLEVLDRKHDCGPSHSPYHSMNVRFQDESGHASIADHLNQPECLEIRPVFGDEFQLVLPGYHVVRS